MKTSSTKLILLSIISSMMLLGCGEGASSSSEPTKTVQNTVDTVTNTTNETVQDAGNTVTDSTTTTTDTVNTGTDTTTNDTVVDNTGNTSTDTTTTVVDTNTTDTNNTATEEQIPVLPNVAYKDLFSMKDSAPYKTGIFVDAHGVQGLKVICGSGENKTEQYGLFTCDDFPLSVYIGNFKLGELSKIPDDKIIYTQDILNIARAATMHPDVTKVSMILQSLDEDAQLSNGIEITQASIDILDNDLANYTNISELTVEDVNNIIDDVIATRKANDSKAKLVKVTKIKAQIDLTEALSNTPPKALNTMVYTSISE